MLMKTQPVNFKKDDVDSSLSQKKIISTDAGGVAAEELLRAEA